MPIPVRPLARIACVAAAPTILSGTESRGSEPPETALVIGAAHTGENLDELDLAAFRRLQINPRLRDGSADPDYATECQFGRKYCDITKELANPTGASSRITTKNTTLCGEGSNEDAVALSAAWVGVTKLVGDDPTIWAQIGYARSRGDIDQSSTVYVRVYAETRWGPNPNERELYSPADPPLLSGSREYQCILILPTLGRWAYNYDEAFYHEITAPGWANQQGSTCDYIAEIFNSKDQRYSTPRIKWSARQDRSACSAPANRHSIMATGKIRNLSLVMFSRATQINGVSSSSTPRVSESGTKYREVCP